MKLTTLAKVAVTLVAIAATLTACGVEDDAASLEPSTELTGSPIVIGTVCTCSGALPDPLFEKTMRAWETWTNANDGVNGHPVKVIIKDDRGDPAVSLQAVKELVEQDHVTAIVGEVSYHDTTWVDYLESKGIPVVGGQVYASPFLSSENFFTSGSSLPVMTVGMVQQAQEKDASNIGVMYCAESPICAELVDLTKVATSVTAPDIEVTGSAVSGSAASYNADCLKLRGGDVDMLAVLSNSTTVMRVVSECAKLGWTPTQVNQAGEYSAAMLGDPNFEGFNISGPMNNFFDETIPGVKEYREALDKADPSIPAAPEFGYQNVYPWLGGQLFKAAAEAADLDASSTPAQVMEGLYALEDETLDGLVPPLNFVKGDKVASLTPCYFVQEIEGGELTTVGDGEPTCLSVEEQKALWPAVLGQGR